MTSLPRSRSPLILLLLAGWTQTACSPREQTTDDTAPAPIDTVQAPGPWIDSTFVPDTTPSTIDTAVAPDTGVATPPITPSQSSVPRDTPPSQEPSAAEQPSGTGQQGGQVSEVEYEGWRQYSVNCARCHGQDVLPNPVAANLLVSVGPNGPVRSPEQFGQVVSEGRPDRGMPAFKGIMTPEQIQALYAYVKGRADKRIPAGRPDRPTG